MTGTSGGGAIDPAASAEMLVRSLGLGPPVKDAWDEPDSSDGEEQPANANNKESNNRETVKEKKKGAKGAAAAQKTPAQPPLNPQTSGKGKEKEKDNSSSNNNTYVK